MVEVWWSFLWSFKSLLVKNWLNNLAKQSQPNLESKLLELEERSVVARKKELEKFYIWNHFIFRKKIYILEVVSYDIWDFFIIGLYSKCIDVRENTSGVSEIQIIILCHCYWKMSFLSGSYFPPLLKDCLMVYKRCSNLFPLK